jgi:transglutaminase-like putative cysteine protease
MHLSIRHETHYDYSTPLEYALQSLCLTPSANEHQTVQRWALQVPGTLYSQVDGYGNHIHTWTLGRRVWRGTVRAQGLVQTHASPELTDATGSLAPQVYLRATSLTEADDALQALGRKHLARGVHRASALALAGDVAARVRYRSGQTDVNTTAAVALEQGEGVCQDQAHVMLAACRANGVAARYVSGYFYAPGAPELASHAWVDVCLDIDARRWLSIDITHRCVMDERHVRLAVGPDYAACPPIRGVRSGGGEEAMKVDIAIEQASSVE